MATMMFLVEMDDNKENHLFIEAIDGKEAINLARDYWGKEGTDVYYPVRAFKVPNWTDPTGRSQIHEWEEGAVDYGRHSGRNNHVAGF